MSRSRFDSRRMYRVRSRPIFPAGALLGILLLQSIPAASLLCREEAGGERKHEVRAVWLTTLLGLDWPSGSLAGDETAQKQSLRNILDDLRAKNFNMIMLQVRSRGNAMYRSTLEPWASELTGVLGRDPGWDPLEFAVAEAHARGMEVHAWVNVCRLWSGSPSPPRVFPPHLYHAHPGWVKAYREELWMDAGIPEAREYAVSVCTDIVRRYDVDGLHLDYIRYPETDFDDARTYRTYGNGVEKGDWRRENINALVRDIYRSATAMKPWVKIGSAPIGIYRNLPTARGWQAYYAVSQDARQWLREGYHDYIAPQIYWGLASRGSRIDFEALVADWKTGSSGKQVYAGIAAYRPEVARYLGEHVDACRRIGVEGVCFFRYQFVRDAGILSDRFELPALVPAMAWKPNAVSPAVRNLAVTRGDEAVHLSWQPPASPVPGGANARLIVYRSRVSPVDISDAENIATILPSGSAGFDDSDRGAKEYYYAVTSVNRFGVESRPVQEGAGTGAPAGPAAASFRFPAVSSAVSAGDGSLVLIGYCVSAYGPVRLRLVNGEGRDIALLVDEKKEAGTYLVGLSRVAIPEEAAGYIYESGDYRVRKSFGQ